MRKISSWFALSLTTFIVIQMKDFGKTILNVSIRAQKIMLEGTSNVMINVVIDIISPN
jgi:hypothetical protein